MNYYGVCLGCGRVSRIYGQAKLCSTCDRARKEREGLRPCACGCGEQTVNTFVTGHNARTFSGAEQQRRGNFNRLKDWSFRKAKPTTYKKFLGAHLHRQILEAKLGRKLTKGEVAHHIDGNQHNNHPDNLVAVSRSEHMHIHIHRKRHA